MIGVHGNWQSMYQNHRFFLRLYFMFTEPFYFLLLFKFYFTFIEHFYLLLSLFKKTLYRTTFYLFGYFKPFIYIIIIIINFILILGSISSQPQLVWDIWLCCCCCCINYFSLFLFYFINYFK